VPKGTGRASTASAVQRATSTTEVALLRTQRARNGTMDKPEWPRMQLRVGADLVHAGNGLFFSLQPHASLTYCFGQNESRRTRPRRSNPQRCPSLFESLLVTARDRHSVFAFLLALRPTLLHDGPAQPCRPPHPGHSDTVLTCPVEPVHLRSNGSPFSLPHAFIPLLVSVFTLSSTSSSPET
jgi:hypothetical protein